jgi:hypothetical protein
MKRSAVGIASLVTVGLGAELLIGIIARACLSAALRSSR